VAAAQLVTTIERSQQGKACPHDKIPRLKVSPVRFLAQTSLWLEQHLYLAIKIGTKNEGHS
jgi:hypothetical protein